MALDVATAVQASRFRNDLGATELSFPDTEIDEIFSMALEIHGTHTLAVENRARIIGIRRLLAQSSKLVTYTANASEEQLSDIFKALEKLLKSYLDEADRLATSTNGFGPVVRFGSMRKTPSTIMEDPNA